MQFHKGEKDAFRIIYDELVRPLTFFAENIVHSQVDAEDIVASAFYKLFHARESMTSFEHIKRWCYVATKNEAIDYIRAKRRKDSLDMELEYLSANIKEEVETERVKTLLLQEIYKEIDELPKQRRIILKMYFLEHRTTIEIAEILQLNPQTVLNHKTKALEALKKSALKLQWMRDGVFLSIVGSALSLFDFVHGNK